MTAVAPTLFRLGPKIIANPLRNYSARGAGVSNRILTVVNLQ